MHTEKTEILRNTLQNIKKPLSIAEISRISNLSRITTARYLDQMHLSGQVKMYEIGRAKKYILSSEQFTHNLCDLSSNFVLILDQYLRVVFVNESYLKASKTNKCEIINRRIDSLNLDIFSSSEILSLLHQFQGEGVKHHHVKFLLNNVYHVYSIAIAKIHFMSNFLATAIIAQDITEKHKTEEMIQFLASIVSSSEDGIIGVDRDGIILSWNDGAEKIFGLSYEEVIGSHISLIFPPDKEQQYTQALKQVITGEVPGLKNTYQISGKEHPIDISYTISPIKKENEKIIGLSLIIKDITDVKSIQNALISSKKKINILSSITRHDILNQLQALDALTDLLSPYLTHEPKALEYLHYISACSSKIRSHIHFTREYQNIGDNLPIWQNIRKTVEAAALDSLPDGVTLTIETDDYEIFADPMLMLAFYNLIENSIRHGKNVDEIRFSVMPESSGGGTLIFQDNGIGVSESEKEEIFEKGYGKNTGLGLFLVREILGITGLAIKENGKENVGARFEIMIPSQALRKN